MATLFSSQVPASLNVSEGAPTTLAIAIVFSASGQITAGRFYGPATVGAGTYEWACWQITGSSTGTLLGSQSFGAISPGVWNSVTLSSPINVTANTAYRIGVRTSDGRYTATGAFFATTLTNGQISSPQDGTNPTGIGTLANGTFASGLVNYPASTFNSTAYFVDADFTPSGAGIIPAGISSPLTLGTPALGLNGIRPTGLPTPLTLGTPSLTQDVAPPVVSTGGSGWFGLQGILQTMRQEAKEQAREGEIACPRCGEPFGTNVNGIVWCKFDGYRPVRGW